MVCYAIVTTKAFENTSIFVILLNSVVMMCEEPADPDPPEFFSQVDFIFLIVYTVEMCFKILGYGFIFGETAYL